MWRQMRDESGTSGGEKPRGLFLSFVIGLRSLPLLLLRNGSPEGLR